MEHFFSSSAKTIDIQQLSHCYMLHKFTIFPNRQVNNVGEAEVRQKAINPTNTQKCIFYSTL